MDRPFGEARILARAVQVERAALWAVNCSGIERSAQIPPQRGVDLRLTTFSRKLFVSGQRSRTRDRLIPKRLGPGGFRDQFGRFHLRQGISRRNNEAISIAYNQILQIRQIPGFLADGSAQRHRRC